MVIINNSENKLRYTIILNFDENRKYVTFKDNYTDITVKKTKKVWGEWTFIFKEASNYSEIC